MTEHLLDVIYPTRCILCRGFLTPPGRPRFCERCAETVMRAKGDDTRGDFFFRCVSALYYEGSARDAIRRYKFGGVQAYAPAFGELVAERIYQEFPDGFDVLSWTPLAWERRWRRGYDQSELIAENVAERLRKPLVRTLRKRFGVPPQSRTKDQKKRRENIRGAYRVADPALIAGKRVLIIDDIVTTGSTLSECAKTLLLGGAEEVLCATLAKTR